MVDRQKIIQDELQKIVEDNSPLFALEMFKQMLIMPFKFRLLVAIKLIFRFNKQKTKDAPAFTQMFTEYRDSLKQLSEAVK